MNRRLPAHRSRDQLRSPERIRPTRRRRRPVGPMRRRSRPMALRMRDIRWPSSVTSSSHRSSPACLVGSSAHSRTARTMYSTSCGPRGPPGRPICCPTRPSRSIPSPPPRCPSWRRRPTPGPPWSGNSKKRPSGDALLAIAHEMAEGIVAPLRRRLADGEGLEGAEESVVTEHVGSAFREWKGERIERLAGDHVVAALSLGTIAVGRQGRHRVGGGGCTGGDPVPRLRGQRAERRPGRGRGLPDRASPPPGPPGVSMPARPRHPLGCGSAHTE